MIFTQEAPLTRKWFSGRCCIRSNWNLKMLTFEERGKPENPEKNLSEQSKELNQLNPLVARARATWVGGECNHHYAILLPNYQFLNSEVSKRLMPSQFHP